MKKIIIFIGMFLSFGVSFCSAEESMTFTMYYPYPNGDFIELKSNKFSIGPDVSSPGSDGQVIVQEGIIFNPLNDAEAAVLSCGAGNQGEIYYKDSDNKFYYCDGSSWQAL